MKFKEYLQKFIYFAICVILFTPILIFGVQRYSQIVLTFSQPKKFKHYYSESENSITLNIINASTQELTNLNNLNNYDSQIIKRLMIKESLDAVEVKMVLKDRNIKATIASFTEPFRIVIDFFDKNFQILHEPQTGLPVYGPTINDNNNFYSYINTADQSYQNEISNNNIDTVNKNDTNNLKFRLMQQMNNVDKIKNFEDLKIALNSIEPKRGKYWNSYPPYIYKIITDIDNVNANNSTAYELSSQDFQSEIALANYAGILFDSGKENHALIVYQYLLYQKPQVFEQNPTHLWKLAEIHLGAGNLTLAEGYYKLLIQKFPSSPLAKFSELRCLDLISIAALNSHDSKKFELILNQLNKMNTRVLSELEAQYLIRASYWKYYSDNNNLQNLESQDIIPEINSSSYQKLKFLQDRLENFYTKLLTQSLLLNAMLADKMPWKKEYGIFANNYFKIYTQNNSEPFRSLLLNKLKNKLKTVITSQTIDGKYNEVISLYTELPVALKSIRKDPTAAWYLGESYRKSGKKDLAFEFYKLAKKGALNSVDKFKALYWIAHISGDLRNEFKEKNINSNKIIELGILMQKSDNELLRLWNALSYDAKHAIETTFEKDLEINIYSDILLKSAPIIMLEIWEKSYGTKTITPIKLSESSETQQLPAKQSNNDVKLFVNLAKRFSKLGMSTERVQALSLLQYIKTSDVIDKQDLQTWIDNMITLAEEYVSVNKFLDAGKIYEQTAKALTSSPHKAELLYKSGLLFYRAAQREDAIKIFTECSQDKNNLYYSNLCSQRLSQMNL